MRTWRTHQYLYQVNFRSSRTPEPPLVTIHDCSCAHSTANGRALGRGQIGRMQPEWRACAVPSLCQHCGTVCIGGCIAACVEPACNPTSAAAVDGNRISPSYILLMRSISYFNISSLIYLYAYICTGPVTEASCTGMFAALHGGGKPRRWPPGRAPCVLARETTWNVARKSGGRPPREGGRLAACAIALAIVCLDSG